MFGGRAGCSEHGRLNHRPVLRSHTYALTGEVAVRGEVGRTFPP
jgi:hypothetical protein